MAPDPPKELPTGLELQKSLDGHGELQRKGYGQRKTEKHEGTEPTLLARPA